MKNITRTFAAVLAATVTVAQAGEIGHYSGGFFDIRDYFIPPEPGIYGVVYNYYYSTDRLNDRNGNQVSSVTVNSPAGPVDVNVNVHLHSYVFAPVLMYASPCTILGANYGAWIAPTFANNTLGAELSIANRAGGNLNNNSSFGVGDLVVQPVWLDWRMDHFDLSLAYAFYAPVGRYNTRTVTLPNNASVTVGSANNIGLGYWTQQAQGAIAWYPWTNKATAVTAVGTYEYNSIQRDTDVRPGQMITLNWGISQYLPLNKCKCLLLEVGPAGYDSWQITDSSGSVAANLGARSQVHGVGGEVGLTYVPWSAFITAHGYYEYASEARFQGASLSLNLGIKF